jgi:leucyl aminopeptidase
MPTFETRKHAATDVDTAVVTVFVKKGGGGPEPGVDAESLANSIEIDLVEEAAVLGFKGDVGQVARIPTRGRAKAPLALVVGLGERPDLDTLRRAAGATARAAGKNEDLAVVVPFDLVEGTAAERAQAVVEGVGLGAYAFTTYRTKTPDAPSLGTVVLLAGEGGKHRDLQPGIETGEVLTRATVLVRDLVNEPPGNKRPPALAKRAEEVARAAKLKVKIHDEKDLAAGGFGGILGVGQGSSEPPRLVEITHAPARAKHHVVLVGKGITFDTGGVSLKPSTAMATMKMDMAGAATVLAVISAVAQLGVRVKVTALLALAENMVSGDAIRVSDVLTHRGGKTVEVLNTDAEGRLVMADALAYGAESEPDVMIDIATLTGAQVVALGSKVTGVMGTDDDVVAGLQAASDATGEAIWRLPLPDVYREHLDSTVADLKNIGKAREAGTVIAGMFLKEFTAGRPWAHLDIAGPAWDDTGDGMLQQKGGTGVCVRLLTRYLQDLAG